VANQRDRRRLPATHSGPKPGDFPIGSLQSRAAARSMLDTMPARQCICFPPDAPPDLALKAEIEAAKAVRCPIHGNRFSELAPAIYVATQYRQLAHLHPERWMGASRQYVKAMEASFPPDRWPAQEVVEPDGGVRFVLKDGTVIHRVSPPPLVYDLDTGKPCGRLGPHGTILPLLQPMVDEEPRDATIEAASAQTGKAEVAQGKEEDDLLILDYEPGRNLGR
jgi:hypothetical protein